MDARASMPIIQPPIHHDRMDVVHRIEIEEARARSRSCRRSVSTRVRAGEGLQAHMQWTCLPIIVQPGTDSRCFVQEGTVHEY
jgi:hypothetical protein